MIGGHFLLCLCIWISCQLPNCKLSTIKLPTAFCRLLCGVESLGQLIIYLGILTRDRHAPCSTVNFLATYKETTLKKTAIIPT